MYSDLYCHLVYSAFSLKRVPYRQNCSSLSSDVSIGPEVAWQATASRSPSQDVRHWDRQAAVICKNCRQARSLKHNPLHLIERKIIPPPIIELRDARGNRVRHGSGILEHAAVLEISRDTSLETCDSDKGLNADRGSPLTDPEVARASAPLIGTTKRIGSPDDAIAARSSV
jgi:hypothetical protein